MSIAVASEGGSRVVYLSETFDSDTARDLRGLLKSLPPAHPVVVDFTFLRDRRLTALVSVTAECAGRDLVKLRGLSEFGVRILEYLGKTKLLGDHARQ